MRPSIVVAILATALLAACGGGGASTATPSDCNGSPCILAISGARGDRSCVLLATGEVRCWGENTYGQVGNVSVSDGLINSASLQPVVVTSLAGASSLGAGSLVGCAVVAGGAVSCWGYGAYGQLGTQTPTGYRNWAAAVPGLSGASAVSVGDSHACALVGGLVECWGTNTSGQLGDGTTTLSLDPVTVPTLAGVTAVAAGSSRTCALVSGGGVRCWGSGYAVDPVPVTTIAGALDIAAGPQFTCVLAGDGTVRCWGDNSFGQLGAAAGPTSSTPVTALNVSGATAIATGSRHACAIVAGGAVKCWGDNYYGQLGGSRGYDTAIQGGFAADYVTSLSGATAITCGSTHTCAVVGRTGVKCWGRNLDGQLGDGTRNPAFTPVDVVF